MIAGNGLIQFSDEYAGFRLWASRNARGYVLDHRSGPEFMMHLGSCWHLEDDRDDTGLGLNEKICSADRRTVVLHSLVKTGRAPLRCKSCNP